MGKVLIIIYFTNEIIIVGLRKENQEKGWDVLYVSLKKEKRMCEYVLLKKEKGKRN